MYNSFNKIKIQCVLEFPFGDHSTILIAILTGVLDINNQIKSLHIRL